MKREEGFYWVRMKGRWIVEFWDPDAGNDGLWCTADMSYDDDHYEEIDERRLARIA